MHEHLTWVYDFNFNRSNFVLEFFSMAKKKKIPPTLPPIRSHTTPHANLWFSAASIFMSHRLMYFKTLFHSLEFSVWNRKKNKTQDSIRHCLIAMEWGTHNKAHVLEMAQELAMGQICFSPSPHSNSKGQRFVWYFDQETAKIHHTHVISRHAQVQVTVSTV